MMKTLNYIFGILAGALMFVSCEDEIGSPNVDSRDFIDVQNAKAVVSNDGTYYILTQYEDPDTIAKYNLTMSVFIVDREEDAVKVEALNGAQYVNFSGIGMKTDYRPEGTDRNKDHYNIMLVNISARDGQ
ncbi:hypothetical protein [Bacteroides sp. An322]|uniref:hypothetical protein n=1 Tax=Bacteroides sp. An322 TaxID=1965632 RepID=UPI000B3A5C05|nr:hypothetical protein [Bacteroides sp. An322]OUO23869.1 hypothetical protein B5F91_01215 [Bacteroides sp. An322]HJC97552.1 hypothetical protein [Candidatus Phocaeicola merdavium]